MTIQEDPTMEDPTMETLWQNSIVHDITFHSMF